MACINAKPFGRLGDWVRKHIEYDPNSGKFTRNGHSVGFKNGDYIIIQLCGRKLRAHRIAWFLYYGEEPTGIIDHINLDKLDNRICNLRVCTDSESQRNKPAARGKKLPFKGIYADRSKFRVRLKIHGRHFSKSFGSLEQAVAYRSELAAKHHGEFARDV